MMYSSFTNPENYHGGVWFAIVLLAIWSLYWKGRALWKSARSGDQVWFIALLVINTAGILDLLYLYAFNQKKEEQKEA